MRSSKAIRPRQTREILRAARHAWAIDRELNFFIVINFPLRDGDELSPQKDFRKIRTKARSWMYHRRKSRVVDPLTDVRVWEAKSGIVHVNWMLHVPDGLIAAFLERLPVWIEKTFGVLSPECYHVTPIYNVNGLLRYALKGTEKGHAHRFGIRHDHQGEVWGRRAVSATCLGRSARERDASSGLIVRTSKFRKTENPAEAGF